MLCYRCGSHVQDGSEKCWNCDTKLAGASKAGGATLEELRERQRTKTRLSGAIYKVGDVLANRYKVKDVAGTGGAGVVYRTHDQDIDVDVALKVVNAKLLQTPEERKLFSREIKTAKKLSHQNIVRIYDEGKDADRAFFTMQFLEGLSLRKIIDLRKEKKQHFALSEVEPIYNQLCQALDYAHKTTLHGDLKPDNVIVLPDLLKVTDFGLLRGLPRKPFLAIQKARQPNFAYLAPEVRLEVEELTPGADLYSLGVILAEMLTGQIVDENKPEQLSVAKTGLDSAVLKVIRRAILRAPKERYGAAGELYEDLRAILAKGDVVARPPQTDEAPAAPSLEVPSSPEVKHSAPPARASEAETEAPTQRLDISKHGARPVAEDEPPARRMPALPLPDLSTEGTGSYAAIDDDMIESMSAPDRNTGFEAARSAEATAGAAPGGPPAAEARRSLPVPPLADPDESTSEVEGEEATEALEELSASEIVLVADPRATNVYEVDHENDRAQIRKPNGAPATPAPDAPRQNVIVSLKPDGSVPSPAFAHVGEHTEAGRLDVPLVAAPPAAAPSVPLSQSYPASLPPPPLASFGLHSGPPPAPETSSGGAVPLPGSVAGKPKKPAPPPTEAVIRGLPAEELARASRAAVSARQAEEVSVVGASDLSEPKVIPRSPTTSMVPDTHSNGANGTAKAAAASKARSRPMTRPRMAAIKSLPPEPSVSIFDGFPKTDTPLDPTGARPLVVTPQGIDRKPTGAKPETRSSREDGKRNRPLIYVGGALMLGLLAVIVLLVVVMMRSNERTNEALRAQERMIAEMRSSATQARQNAQAATDERKQIETAQKASDDTVLAAKKAAEEAELAKKKAQEEADKLAREQKAGEADAKRKEAAEAEKKRQAELAKVETEEKKQADLEAKRLAAADKEAKAKAAAEERERKLREREEATEAKRLAAEEAALKRAEQAEASSAKKAEAAEAAAAKKAADDAKKAEAAEAAAAKKADDEARKKAEGEAATAAAVAAVPAGKTCPKGMALIESGAFMMGAPRNDPERNFGDKTYASVEVTSFCVDYYEAPNGRGREPITKVTWSAADKACKAKQKRLCSEDEWEKACKGPSGLRYPYGNQWDPALCATEDDEGNDRQIAKSGTFERCRSGYTVLDLSGNVAEWTSTAWEGGDGYVVKGGSADRPGYDGRCAARKKKPGGQGAETLGYRCCANPQ